MALIPLRFGETSRQLFALLQTPGGPAPSDHGVLLCNPFGQEAIRAHRLLRVLGERLCNAGFAVMRFDYFGTGDSDGDDTEGSIAHWVDNILMVDSQLRTRSGASRTTWIGIRLGATLAATAAARANPPPAGLILWDPIVDGNAYLGELAAAHAASLVAGAAGLATARRLSRPNSRPSTSPNEALGFPLAEALRIDINALSPAPIANCPVPISVIVSPDAPPSCMAPDAVGRRAQVHRLSSPLDWVAITQMQSAVVPGDALQAIHDSLGKRP